MKRAFFVWLLFIPLGILNGWLREGILLPVAGPYALPLSGVLLCLLILGVSFCLVSGFKRTDVGFYAAIGLFWVVLTMIFEFGMGLFVLKKPFLDLLQAYDPTTGNLWLLVIMVIGAAPLSMAKIRRMI